MELWVKNSLKNIKPKTESNDKDLTTDLNPKIFFGIFNQSSISGKVQDNETFLSYSDFTNAHNSYSNSYYPSLFSQQFRDAINEAQKRIWLIDGYLSESDSRSKLDSMIDMLHQRMFYIDDIRIFFKKDEHKTDIDEVLKVFNADLLPKVHKEIQYKFFDYRFIHDRFAIIDDVLWHFGSDVGSTNKSIHATSYGWDANYLKAIKFFEDFWSAGYEK